MSQPTPENPGELYDRLAATYVFIHCGGLNIMMTHDLGPVDGVWDTAEELGRIRRELHVPDLRSRMSFRIPRPEITQVIGVIVTKPLENISVNGIQAADINRGVGSFLASTRVFGLIDARSEMWADSVGLSACELACDAISEILGNLPREEQRQMWTYQES